MTAWRDVLRGARQRLERAGVEDAGREAVYLWEWATGRSFSDWVAWDGELSRAQRDRFDEGLARRTAREPMAYITGHREFYGLDLAVSPAVLIPRPETEILVEVVLSARLPEPRVVVDVGTGSGAIALALKSQRPDWDVIGLDVSSAALAQAQENGQRLGLAVRWRCSDLLAAIAGPVAGIVANLPYVPHTWNGVVPELGYEPADALYADAEGLALIIRLIQAAQTRLVSGGFLFMECGIGQSEQIVRELDGEGYDQIQRAEDYAGIERVVWARWPGRSEG